MKLNKMIFALALVVAGALASTGCRHEPVNVTNIPETKPAFGDLGSGTLNGGEGGSTQIAENTPFDPSKWNQDRTTLAPDAIHFAYDSAVVRHSEHTKLQEVANALAGNSSAMVLIEGNCDERGTEEYNRALGQRRADAAREELVKLGVDASRINTMSNGKDQPAATGHDQSSWAQNRRDDFVLLTPKTGV